MSDKEIERLISSLLDGVYRMALPTNLAVEALANLPVVAKIKKFFTSLFLYYGASPKRHLKVTKFAEIVEIKS